MARRALPQHNTSGYLGVSRWESRQRWIAQIRHEGKNVYIGVFPDAESAARAWDAKALELLGPEVQLNFPAKAGSVETEAETEYRKIPLTQGLFAVVDAADYHDLAQYRWCAQRQGAGLRWYAVRSKHRTSGQRRSLVLMHTQIMRAEQGQEVDHIDGDGLNNRRGNLRLVTRSENCANRARSTRNKSGYIGVSWLPRAGKWHAQIRSKGRNFNLGLFEEPVEAAKARDAKALELHGEFAALNFPPAGRAQNRRAKA